VKAPVLLRTHNGFGDVIYERPVVERIAEREEQVYLATAWPEVFRDLPLRFVKADTRLAWSTAHMEAQTPETWSELPRGVQTLDLRLHRLRGLLKSRSMVDLMAQVARVSVRAMSLPPLPASPVKEGRLAVVRPVTLRKDWKHESRTPRPEYMVDAAALLRDQGYFVVSVAGISDAEPYLGEPPFAHRRFDRGELGPLELLALVKAADVVVTGPGWAVPAALAAGMPLVVIAGGAGGTNGPAGLVPSWYRGPVTWIKPDPYCPCIQREHACNKTIPRFKEQFRESLVARAAA
jgi:hypothetical protein